MIAERAGLVCIANLFPLAFGDDPAGYGKNLEDMEHLATPQMRWLGIHPSDVETLQLPIECRLPLTKRDRSLIDSLDKRPFFGDNAPLHNQVDSSLFGLVHTRSLPISGHDIYLYVCTHILHDFLLQKSMPTLEQENRHTILRVERE